MTSLFLHRAIAPTAGRARSTRPAAERDPLVTADTFLARPRPHAPAHPVEKALLAFTVLYFVWQFGRAVGAGVL